MWVLLLAAHAGEPVLAIDAVEPDTCGNVRGTVLVRPRRKPGEVALSVDGVDLATVPVPSRAASVPFVLGVGADASGEVGARWRFVDAAPVPYRTPPWEVALAVDVPHEPPPQGEVPPLGIRALGPCTDAPWLVDVTVVETGAPLAFRAPVGELPLDLPQGQWTLRVELRDASATVTARDVPYAVGAPCLDTDGDGFLSCRSGDCDDRDARVHPGATDTFGDGIDQDCDGVNGRDADRDGFEDAAAGGTDCADRDPLVHPGATAFPDPDGDGALASAAVDFDCDGDVDRREAPYDCDESDPRRPRDEAPTPTGVDEDCDGLVDEGTVAFDDDGDGFAEVDGDCRDADPTVNPRARETPDCRDEDCDGEIDEGAPRAAKDDRYERTDGEPAEVPGAYWRSGLLGGSWRSSRTEVRAVTRDLDDDEGFTVYAHDGDLDTFHVSVTVLRMGDGRTYEIVLVAPDGHELRSTVAEPGQGVSIPGRPGRSDTGDWRIEVRPVSGELPWCPIDLRVSTG